MGAAVMGRVPGPGRRRGRAQAAPPPRPPRPLPLRLRLRLRPRPGGAVRCGAVQRAPRPAGGAWPGEEGRGRARRPCSGGGARRALPRARGHGVRREAGALSPGPSQPLRQGAGAARAPRGAAGPRAAAGAVPGRPRGLGAPHGPGAGRGPLLPAGGALPGLRRAAAAAGHRGVQAGDPGAARALGAAEGRRGAAHPPAPQAAGAAGPLRGRAQHPRHPGAPLLQGEEQEREADVRQVQHHHLGPHPDLVHLHRLLLPLPQQVPAAGHQGLRAVQGEPPSRVRAQHLPRERPRQPGLPLRRVPGPRLPPRGAQRGPAVRLHRPLLLQQLPLERPGRHPRPRHPQLGLRAPQGVPLQHAVPGADGVAAGAEAAGDQPAALQLRGGAGGDPEAAPGHPAHEAVLHHLQGGHGGPAAAAAAGPAALRGERRDVLAAGPHRHRGRAPELLPDGDPHPLRQAHQARLRALPGEGLRVRALQGRRRALPLRQPHLGVHRLLRRLPQGLLLRQLDHVPALRPAEPAQAVPLPGLQHRGRALGRPGPTGCFGGPAPEGLPPHGCGALHYTSTESTLKGSRAPRLCGEPPQAPGTSLESPRLLAVGQPALAPCPGRPRTPPEPSGRTELPPSPGADPPGLCQPPG